MTGGIGQDDILPVKEVLLTGVGHKNKKPLLVAFVEQDLLIYEAFTFAESSLEGHLNLRFKKVRGWLCEGNVNLFFSECEWFSQILAQYF